MNKKEMNWDKIIALSIIIIPPSISLIPMFMHTGNWAIELLIFGIYAVMEIFVCKTIIQDDF